MDAYCKVYHLVGPFTKQDFNWMDKSGIDIKHERPYKCDDDTPRYFTDEELMIYGYQFTAFITDDKQDTWLCLYWGDRATLLTSIPRNKHDSIVQHSSTMLIHT